MVVLAGRLTLVRGFPKNAYPPMVIPGGRITLVRRQSSNALAPTFVKPTGSTRLEIGSLTKAASPILVGLFPKMTVVKLGQNPNALSPIAPPAMLTLSSGSCENAYAPTLGLPSIEIFV